MKCTRCGNKMRLYYRSTTKYRCTAKCQAIKNMQSKNELEHHKFLNNKGKMNISIDYLPNSDHNYHGCPQRFLD